MLITSVTLIIQMCNYDVIISHGPGCPDGAVAAWAVWRTLLPSYRYILEEKGGFYSNRKEYDENFVLDPNYVHPNSPEGAIALQKEGLSPVFVFIQPSTPVPEELVKDKSVLILDLDMGDFLVPLVKSSKSTFLCDHHDSSMKTISKNSNVLLNESGLKFAMMVNTSKSESGASLAWKIAHNTDIPLFVNIVRIGDTWMWDDYPDARHILASLHANDIFSSFPRIEEEYINFGQNIYDHVDQGRLISRYKNDLAKQMAKHCDLATVRTKDGHEYTVAYAEVTILKSEVGSMIRFYAEKKFPVKIDFTASWSYFSDKGFAQVSLRDPRPGLNLADVAQNIDIPDIKGGGHPQAAGFTFSGIENFHKVFQPYEHNKPSLDEILQRKL